MIFGFPIMSAGKNPPPLDALATGARALPAGCTGSASSSPARAVLGDPSHDYRQVKRPIWRKADVGPAPANDTSDPARICEPRYPQGTVFVSLCTPGAGTNFREPYATYTRLIDPRENVRLRRSWGEIGGFWRRVGKVYVIQIDNA
jgi:hypothetical protein